ncbi:class I SAM-dependent methyltransferase [Dissulfurispira thermophila]|uniref:class I SAM-dependent methyltransferase n=1 Tax=Dissulfurispira thermophila TaxID=2715679 RepID=UPI00193D536A|nr:class I SAM-dependent methyltransferase [Dissulfurispira thermophila]
MKICPSYLSFILYNPIRKILTDREKILDESGISASSVVLEVGAGNGFITEAIAQRAKKVYAVELQHGMVKKLRKRVEGFGSKVDILLCDIANCDIVEGLADVCIMYYSFHEIGNQAGAVRNIWKAIKNDGILSIYEPTIEVNKASMQETIGMFQAIGFERELERDSLFTRFVRLRRVKNK